MIYLRQTWGWECNGPSCHHDTKPSCHQPPLRFRRIAPAKRNDVDDLWRPPLYLETLKRGTELMYVCADIKNRERKEINSKMTRPARPILTLPTANHTTKKRTTYRERGAVVYVRRPWEQKRLITSFCCCFLFFIFLFPFSFFYAGQQQLSLSFSFVSFFVRLFGPDWWGPFMSGLSSDGQTQNSG